MFEDKVKPMHRRNSFNMRLITFGVVFVAFVYGVYLYQELSSKYIKQKNDWEEVQKLQKETDVQLQSMKEDLERIQRSLIDEQMARAKEMKLRRELSVSSSQDKQIIKRLEGEMDGLRVQLNELRSNSSRAQDAYSDLARRFADLQAVHNDLQQLNLNITKSEDDRRVELQKKLDLQLDRFQTEQRLRQNAADELHKRVQELEERNRELTFKLASISDRRELANKSLPVVEPDAGQLPTNPAEPDKRVPYAQPAATDAKPTESVKPVVSEKPSSVAAENAKAQDAQEVEKPKLELTTKATSVEAKKGEFHGQAVDVEAPEFGHVPEAKEPEPGGLVAPGGAEVDLAAAPVREPELPFRGNDEAAEKAKEELGAGMQQLALPLGANEENDHAHGPLGDGGAENAVQQRPVVPLGVQGDHDQLRGQQVDGPVQRLPRHDDAAADDDNAPPHPNDEDQDRPLQPF